MSAGEFLKSKYQASYGAGTQIHPIRVQPETIVADFADGTNEPPTGAVNNPISAIISRGAKAKGLRPRFVTIKLQASATPPEGYKALAITRIPILTSGVFNDIEEGQVVNYLGAAWNVIGKTNEDAQ